MFISFSKLAKPIKVATSNTLPFEVVLNEYDPSSVAAVPSYEPLINTLAPASGSPLVSVILPFTMVCAQRVTAESRIVSRNAVVFIRIKLMYG